jgi:protein involved in sex pheromone biosynthesis
MNVRKIAFFLVCLSVLGLNGCSNTVSQKEKNIVQSDSLYKEGQKYFLGDGVEQNYKKALKFPRCFVLQSRTTFRGLKMWRKCNTKPSQI